jgi:hypothetical protein
MLPYSEACERNKHPILKVLRVAFADCSRVIEIGAGTGQHAAYFGWQLAHLTWQPTERREALAALAERVAAEGAPNVAPPVALDVLEQPWPRLRGDAAFTANTLHIMPWHATVAMFAGLGRLLAAESVIAVYGPFKYGGRFTTRLRVGRCVGAQGRLPARGRSLHAGEQPAHRLAESVTSSRSIVSSQMRRQSNESAVSGGRSLGTCCTGTGTNCSPSRAPTTNAKTNQGVWPMRRSVMTIGLPAMLPAASCAAAVSTRPRSCRSELTEPPATRRPGEASRAE